MRRFFVSLGWKLTASFALFGLLLSWLGIMLYGTKTTAEIISSVESTLRATTSQLFPDRSYDFISSLRRDDNDALLSVLRSTAGGLSSEGRESASIAFRLRRIDEQGAWYAPASGPYGELELVRAQEREAPALERSLNSRGKRLSPPIFSGMGDRISVYIDLSRPGDEWLLVAAVQISRESAFNAFARHSGLLLSALFLWSILCIFISQFLGRRLAAPILELSEQAKGRDFNISPATLARRDEIGSLARTLNEMNSLIADERRELEDRARALEAMNRIDRAVLEGKTRPLLLDKVLGAVIDYAACVAAGINVRDPDGGGFDVVASKWAVPDAAGRQSYTGFVEDDAISPEMLVRYSDCFEVPLSAIGPEFPALLGYPEDSGLNYVNLPFEVSGFYSGSLVLIREPGGPDLPRLKPLADQVGVALKDLETREGGERNWLAVMRSLVRAVDAKSAWTHGHSERVGCLSAAMGKRLLMDEKELASLDIAAALHDVGKIGVPEAILDKPGRLDDREMELVRRHPIIGAGIVEDIPDYGEVRSAILHHHERWDGSGYPEGLVGEKIPFFARIIALADVYDAITDDRPYRKGMGLEEARSFIEKSSGSLFDPGLARIFLEVVSSREKEGAAVAADSA